MAGTDGCGGGLQTGVLGSFVSCPVRGSSEPVLYSQNLQLIKHLFISLSFKEQLGKGGTGRKTPD